MVDYVAANAEALDKAQAALDDAIKSNPLGTQAVYQMIDWSSHRDFLLAHQRDLHIGETGKNQEIKNPTRAVFAGWGFCKPRLKKTELPTEPHQLMSALVWSSDRVAD